MGAHGGKNPAVPALAQLERARARVNCPYHTPLYKMMYNQYGMLLVALQGIYLCRNHKLQGILLNNDRLQTYNKEIHLFPSYKYEWSIYYIVRCCSMLRGYNLKQKSTFLIQFIPVGGIWTLNEEINYEVYVIMESKIKKNIATVG